jgi:hypothetical protein
VFPRRIETEIDRNVLNEVKSNILYDIYTELRQLFWFKVSKHIFLTAFFMGTEKP